MFQISFILPSEIEEVAQEARHRFCLSEVRVDVEFVLDVKLGMDLILSFGSDTPPLAALLGY